MLPRGLALKLLQLGPGLSARRFIAKTGQLTEKGARWLPRRSYTSDSQTPKMEALEKAKSESKPKEAKKLIATASPLGEKEAVTSKTQTLEIKTSKGILSVTTTIEDSKINDVILEKTSGSKVLPAGKASKVDLVQDATSAQPSELPTKKVGVTSTTGVKKVVAALLQKKETAEAEGILKTEAKTTTIQADVHVLEKKVKKKPVTATGKAIEKLTAAVGNVTPAAAATDQPTTDTAATPATPIKPQRVCVDFNRSSLERNFITPARAMSDFLLKPNDLEDLPKIKRRSPYEQEPPMTVFWRRDVESKAIAIWGSRENLLKELLKREIERKKHQQNIFTVKRRLRDYRREIGARTATCSHDRGLQGESGKVILIAVAINGVNFLFKVVGWLYTGSHSMFAECIHSLADTINQLILAYGIHKSQQHADPDHPYGYSNWKYVSSLISGVGIFCVGTGLSMYHGITGLMHPEPLQDLFWALCILGGSLVSEGATLLVAANEVRRSAGLQKISFKEYVMSGRDPCVNVVLMEDAAAVSSVAVAVVCMSLSSLTGSPVFDAVGSLIVGSILGCVASFIIYTNTAALVGKSIAQEHLERINAELESDVMIRAIHDVKGIDMGNSLVRYKAEMDFDGRELTRSYLDKQDLNELLKVVKSFQTVEELEKFLLSHGENIVDLMGGEIDRIEMKLRKKFPEIRHCDLEIL